MDDLVRHVEKLSKNFERVIWAGELRVATKTERKAEAEELRAQMEAEAERPKPEQDQ
jgi:hypothetical protein